MNWNNTRKSDRQLKREMTGTERIKAENRASYEALPGEILKRAKFYQDEGDAEKSAFFQELHDELVERRAREAA